MDAVNRYTIKLNTVASATTINIPIDLNFGLTDQSDIIERDFVGIELEKSVNDIVDYGTVRFNPVTISDINVNSIKYKLNFNIGNNYDSIGFIHDDILYRRNNFKRSFLQLDFYDSKSMVNQNFLYSSTLYCRVLPNMFYGGTLKGLVNIPTEFTLYNPTTNPYNITEGFYVYDYKGEIPKDIYMRSTFNNAKNGKSTIFMNTSIPKRINELQDNLFLNYKLTYENGVYVYRISNNINVSTVGGDITINLYEVNVI